jgi:hypothetical protein
MTRRTPLFASFAAAAVLCALLAVRPHVVDRWALYLGTPSAPNQARLFLDPFPDAASCESRARVFAANAERAFCTDRRELEFGTALDAVLAADFDPFFANSWYCSPRRKRL